MPGRLFGLLMVQLTMFGVFVLRRRLSRHCSRVCFGVEGSCAHRRPTINNTVYLLLLPIQTPRHNTLDRTTMFVFPPPTPPTPPAGESSMNCREKSTRFRGSWCACSTCHALVRRVWSFMFALEIQARLLNAMNTTNISITFASWKWILYTYIILMGGCMMFVVAKLVTLSPSMQTWHTCLEGQEGCSENAKCTYDTLPCTWSTLHIMILYWESCYS